MTDLEAYEQWRDSKIAEGDSDVNPFMIWNAALRFARKAAWTPISKRLPDECQLVLVSGPDLSPRCGRVRDAKWYEEGEGRALWPGLVQSWMPLPELPS